MSGYWSNLLEFYTNFFHQLYHEPEVELKVENSIADLEHMFCPLFFQNVCSAQKLEYIWRKSFVYLSHNLHILVALYGITWSEWNGKYEPLWTAR
jgi:hypothetical protein